MKRPSMMRRALVGLLILLALALGILATVGKSAFTHRLITDGSMVFEPPAWDRAGRFTWRDLGPLDATGVTVDRAACFDEGSRDLIFARRVEGAGFDLHRAKWTPAGYAAPEPVFELNSPGDDTEPTFAEGGKVLYFASDREGGLGGFDLYRTERTREGFTPPRPLGSPVNTSADDRGPTLGDGGDRMILASNRLAEDKTRLELYECRRVAGEFLEPQRISSLSSEDSGESRAAALSPDGRFLIFASDREGGPGGFDLYRSLWFAGAWQAPELVRDLSGAADEVDPAFSAEGGLLVFARSRGTDSLATSLHLAERRELMVIEQPQEAWAWLSRLLMALALLALLTYLFLQWRELHPFVKFLLASLIIHILFLLYVHTREPAPLPTGLGGERTFAVSFLGSPAEAESNRTTAARGDQVTANTPIAASVASEPERPATDAPEARADAPEVAATPRDPTSLREIASDLSQATAPERATSHPAARLEGNASNDVPRRAAADPAAKALATNAIGTTAERRAGVAPTSDATISGPGEATARAALADSAAPQGVLVAARDSSASRDAAPSVPTPARTAPDSAHAATRDVAATVAPVRNAATDAPGGPSVASTAASDTARQPPTLTTANSIQAEPDGAPALTAPVAASIAIGGARRSAEPAPEWDGPSRSKDGPPVRSARETPAALAGESLRHGDDAPVAVAAAATTTASERARGSTGSGLTSQPAGAAPALTAPSASTQFGREAGTAVGEAEPSVLELTRSVRAPRLVAVEASLRADHGSAPTVVGEDGVVGSKLVAARSLVAERVATPLDARSALGSQPAEPTFTETPRGTSVAGARATIGEERPTLETIAAERRPTRPLAPTAAIAAATGAAKLAPAADPELRPLAASRLESVGTRTPSAIAARPLPTEGARSRGAPDVEPRPRDHFRLRDVALDEPSDARTSVYAQRSGAARARALLEAGGSRETEAAVLSGLRYLRSRQTEDGTVGRPYRDEKYGDVEVGKTALALLAFSGSGATHDAPGEFQEAVGRCLQRLTAVQDRDTGHFGDCSSYGHAIATYAFAEAFAMTKDTSLRPTLLRATRRIQSAQIDRPDEVADGGFGYYYRAPERSFDRWPRMSVSVWQIMALESARLGGIDIPDEVFHRAKTFVENSHDPRRRAIRYNHDPEWLRSRYAILPGSTSGALFAMQLLGIDDQSAAFADALDFVRARPPRGPWRRPSSDDFVLQAIGNEYYLYYATLALRFLGGDDWTRWNDALKPLLLESQDRDGSWRPISHYADYAKDTERDRVYTTAMCVLMLEVYYRYDTPLLKKLAASAASRPEVTPSEPKVRLVVVSVTPRSRAARAGMREGDVLVSIGSTHIKDLDHLQSVLAEPPGESTAVTIVRDGAPLRLQLRGRLSGVDLEERPR